VEVRPEGGYTSACEVICCGCDDHPYPDYPEVLVELQQIRGPRPIGAALAAYDKHLALDKQPVRRDQPGLTSDAG